MTGIDIVKAQIHILEGDAIGTPESGVPPQEDIRLNGHALQCRITTEDPEQNFIPDYGRITAYRGATGFGIRLDGGTAYSGAVITRYYDPLLEKVTAWAPTPAEAIARMDRALREFRIRGVATNLTFLEAIITHPEFQRQQLHDALHRHDAGAVPAGQAPGPRHQAADLSRRRHRQRPSRDARAGRGRPPMPPSRVVPLLRRRQIADGTKQLLDELGPKKFAEWMRDAEARAGHRHDDARRPPVAARDPHAHLRHRRASPAPMRARCRSCCRSNAGAARPSTSPCAS